MLRALRSQQINMKVNRQNIFTPTHMFVLVSQRAWHICSIDGRNVRNVFPIFSLQILVVKAWWSVVSRIFSNFPVLLDGHWFFGNVDLLIEALLASYHLENKVIKLYSTYKYISEPMNHVDGIFTISVIFCIKIICSGLKWTMELEQNWQFIELNKFEKF